MGRYQILAPIASGGMGMVYLARSRGVGGFERDVALKLLHPHAGHRDHLTRELIEEAKLTALIRHPNVVQVYDVDEDELGVFMAMEYVEGCSLSDLLRALSRTGGSLPPEIGLRVLLDALAGLHAAHELEGPDGRPLGLIHRDFSPQNILIGTDGVSKLADFGIAKAAGREGRTATGAIKGKLSYLAPEQIRGTPMDRRCDVWAAGVVAWEIFAGKRLFSSPDEATTMYRILEETPPRLRASGADVPHTLDEAVARALVKVPSSRCPSAAAFARALAAGGIEPAPAEEVGSCVRRLVGEELTARRARVAETLRSRSATSMAPPPLGEAPLGEVTSVTRDAPAVTAPAFTAPPWAGSTRRVRMIAVLAIGAGAVAAVLALSGSPSDSTGASGTGVPVGSAPLPDITVTAPVPAVTVEPSVPATATTTQESSSAAPSASAAPSGRVAAPSGTGRAKPPKKSLPLADSPYNNKKP